jgi:hypothetical protein
MCLGEHTERSNKNNRNINNMNNKHNNNNIKKQHNSRRIFSRPDTPFLEKKKIYIYIYVRIRWHCTYLDT